MFGVGGFKEVLFCVLDFSVHSEASTEGMNCFHRNMFWIRTNFKALETPWMHMTGCSFSHWLLCGALQGRGWGWGFGGLHTSSSPTYLCQPGGEGCHSSFSPFNCSEQIRGSREGWAPLCLLLQGALSDLCIWLTHLSKYMVQTLVKSL